MSERQMCRKCFCLGYDLVPVNGEWSCMEHLNGRDAATEIVRLSEQLAERTLQHQTQLDNAVRLTERLAAAEALLTTACDAWECGQMVWNQEGVLLSDYKAAMLPRAWYEAANGGRDERPASST